MRFNTKTQSMMPVPSIVKVGDVFRNTKGGLYVCCRTRDKGYDFLSLTESGEIKGFLSYCRTFVHSAAWAHIGTCEMPTELHINFFP